MYTTKIKLFLNIERILTDINKILFQILKDIPRMTSLAHLLQQKVVQEVSITKKGVLVKRQIIIN